MKLNRRKFCQAAAASMVCAGHGLDISLVQASSFDLGNGSKLTTFSDGQMSLPVNMLFTDVPKDRLAMLLAEQNASDDMLARPLNVVLLEDGQQKILFDVGSGANFLNGLGQLPPALEAAGIDLSEITNVVFTHAHPDHIWGVMDDFDELLMPDVRYHISAAEWAFWDSDDTLSAMPPGREAFAVGAKTRFELIRKQIELFSFGDEVLPSVEAVDSRGHTPGHTSFILHHGQESAMVLGDALTHSLISFAHPEWKNESDMDRDQAVQTRLRILDRITTDKMVISGYHLPRPGLGRAEKATSGGWRYLTS